MAAATGKRKREREARLQPVGSSKRLAVARPEQKTSASTPVSVQIVAGSYDRLLHGFTATLSPPPPPDASPLVSFSHTFLFAAHASAVRCLAVSPPTENDKRMLATGSSDERINLYSVSTVPPPSALVTSAADGLAAGVATVAQNPLNRSLGSLIHHDKAITRLHFASKSKLFSAGEDNTVAVSRTRDWTVLSSIKAPLPHAHGRPSGDTATASNVPAGINDFAIHPSSKLMLSVSRGEKCMRLWNLMTGKKAGVLSFDRDLLASLGEGKFGGGDGRSILWHPDGDSYVVAFERGAIVFGVDSKPTAMIKASPPTKLHRMHFLSRSSKPDLLAVSTEDGRILFFDVAPHTPVQGQSSLPISPCRAQLGGRAAAISGRIKDFTILSLPDGGILVVTAGSDGDVRLWAAQDSEFHSNSGAPDQVGQLIGTLETGNRITCIDAFVMDGESSETALGELEPADGNIGGDEEDTESSSSSSIE